MSSNSKQTPKALSTVALLTDLPDQNLSRGQVGTVVESIDKHTVLVEFSDDDGQAYALARCPVSDLLTLHFAPESA
jgi:hypothetical protein